MNSDLYSSFGTARPDEQGRYLTFFTPNASPGTFDPATGLPLTGEWKLAVQHDVPNVYPEGVYDLTWSGSGTGPVNANLVAGDDLKNYTFNGDLGNFRFDRRDATSEWTPTFLDRVGCAYTFRWMEALRTNFPQYDSASPFVRVVPGANNLNVHRIPTPEHIRDLANLTGAVPWINIHCQATDADVLDFAQRLTGIQTKVRVSHANETWNASIGNSFACSDQKAQDLNYTGGQAARVSAYNFDRADQIAEIFKSVLGFQQVIGVVESQLRQPSLYTLALINRKRTWQHLNSVALGYYSGGPWARTTDPAIILGLNFQQIINEARVDWQTNVINDGGFYDQWKAHAAANGWLHEAYEGGLHLKHEDPHPQRDDANEWMTQAANSPFAGEFEQEVLAWWSFANPMGVFAAFRETGEDVFGYQTTEIQPAKSTRCQSWRTYACGG